MEYPAAESSTAPVGEPLRKVCFGSRSFISLAIETIKTPRQFIEKSTPVYFAETDPMLIGGTKRTWDMQVAPRNVRFRG
jgi:hypothetical protein